MVRLTHKNHKIEIAKNRKLLEKDIDLICDKLGQLEDIEEQLGIDLITLFKDVHEPMDFIKKYGISKAWIFTDYIGNNKNNFGKATLQKCEIKSWHEKGNDIRFETKDGWLTARQITDYGKTWALTKEELE